MMVDKWLEIADRHGTPLMFALMFAVALAFLFWWFSRSVAKPLITSHQRFLEMTAKHTALNSQSLDKLVEANEQQALILKAHDVRLERIEQNVSKCPIAAMMKNSDNSHV